MVVLLILASSLFLAASVGLVSDRLPTWAVLVAYTGAFVLLLFLLASSRKLRWGRRHQKKRDVVYELYLKAEDIPAEWQRLSPKKLVKNVLIPLLRSAGGAADHLALARVRLRFWRLSLVSTARQINQAVHAILDLLGSLRQKLSESRQQQVLDQILEQLQHEDAAQQQIQTVVSLLQSEEAELSTVKGLLSVYGYDLDKPSAEGQQRFREAVAPSLKTKSEKEILTKVLKGEKA